jgi:hypothetical protein
MPGALGIARANFNDVGEFFDEYAQDGITAAAGGGQSGAFQLTRQTNRITTVATAADSIKLPPAVPGREVTIINRGANPLQCFGSGTDTVDQTGATVGVSQMQNSACLYFCATAGVWETEGLATGYSGSYQTISTKNAITAHAGGTQAGAIADANAQLPAMQNRVTVVGTAADSVVLPTAVAGMNIVVANAAAVNSMNLFPNTGDAINALAANAAFAVAAGKVATLYCMVAGTWHALLSA